MGRNPDWGRMGISAPHSFSALGDPTRWGGVDTPPSTTLQDGVPVLFQSGQILSVQCRDSYPRAWTMVGTLTAPAEFFLLPDLFNPALNYWLAAAYVSMGVGQVQIIHSFNLRAIIDADSDFYWNSALDQPFFEESGNGIVSRPFIMPGALVGTAISVRIFHALRIAGSGPIGPFSLTTQLLVTPFDAGATPNVGGPVGTGAVV